MNESGKIAVISIKRFTVHDGPGIRTTVFFKGCSLHCPWCQNPEGISKGKNLLFQQSKCIKCHTCMNHCPQKAISLSDESGQIQIDRSKCNLCGICIEHCPSQALSFDSTEMEVSELVHELMKDQVFYEVSNGGVTFSGGEPLLEAEKILKIAKLLKENNIHIAVETSLMIATSSLKNIFQYINLFIVDIKLLDPQRSKEVIGMDINLFYQNLEFLISSKAEIVCRTPLIPGYTTDLANLQSIQSFIITMNGEYNRELKIELINFNPLSKTKYLQLGKPVPSIERWQKYTSEELQAFKRIFNIE